MRPVCKHKHTTGHKGHLLHYTPLKILSCYQPPLLDSGAPQTECLQLIRIHTMKCDISTLLGYKYSFTLQVWMTGLMDQLLRYQALTHPYVSVCKYTKAYYMHTCVCTKVQTRLHLVPKYTV